MIWALKEKIISHSVLKGEFNQNSNIRVERLGKLKNRLLHFPK